MLHATPHTDRIFLCEFGCGEPFHTEATRATHHAARKLCELGCGETLCRSQQLLHRTQPYVVPSVAHNVSHTSRPLVCEFGCGESFHTEATRASHHAAHKLCKPGCGQSFYHWQQLLQARKPCGMGGCLDSLCRSQEARHKAQWCVVPSVAHNDSHTDRHLVCQFGCRERFHTEAQQTTHYAARKPCGIVGCPDSLCPPQLARHKAQLCVVLSVAHNASHTDRHRR